MLCTTSTVLLSGPQFDTLNASLQGITAAVGHQSFWNTQLFAAVVGASLGLIPSLYLVYKDRPRIKVKINPSFIALAGNTIQTGFSISIFNFGQRPIIADRVFLKFKDGSALWFASESNFVGGSRLPVTLGEGNSHSVTILADVIKDELLKQKDNYPVYACYSDAVGRVYKAKTSKKFWDKMFKVASSDKK